MEEKIANTEQNTISSSNEHSQSAEDSLAEKKHILDLEAREKKLDEISNKLAQTSSSKEEELIAREKMIAQKERELAEAEFERKYNEDIKKKAEELLKAKMYKQDSDEKEQINNASKHVAELGGPTDTVVGSVTKDRWKTI